MAEDIEHTNQHRELTSEIVSSLKMVRQELNEEAHVHASAADTMLDPKIALLVALDKEWHRAAFSHISSSLHETLILHITAIPSANGWNCLIFEPMESRHCTMTTGAPTGDPIATKSHSPATPKAATGFESYIEYLLKLDRSSSKSYFNCDGDILWLASFNGDGRCTEWNYCDPSNKDSYDVPRNLPAVDGSGIRPHTTILSHHALRMALQSPDENAAYRIVLVDAGSDYLSWETKDILGLGLDLTLEEFEYAQMCVQDPYGKKALLPRYYYKALPALRIGQNALYILDAGPEKALKTAILFIGRGYVPYILGGSISTSFVMYPCERPSQMLEGSRNPVDRPDPRYQNIWLIQRFITSGIGSDSSFGKGNFLYTCLEALVELHSSTVPLNVPHIGRYGLESPVTLEYCGQYETGTKQLVAFAADASLIWSRLRNDVDEQRSTLRWMTRFFRKHFDYSNQDIQAAFDDTMERFELRLQDLEQSESQLRDHLAVASTTKSIHVAKMSIRESKRVLLLTALAFIFLPVSLASSVYGMNVQQINGTGHSIRAFVITAVAMCVSSLTLWAAFAAFQSYRNRLKSEREKDRSMHRAWHTVLIIDGPLIMCRYLWSG